MRLNYLDLTKKTYVCNFKRFKLHTSIYFISLSDELNLLFCLLLYLFYSIAINEKILGDCLFVSNKDLVKDVLLGFNHLRWTNDRQSRITITRYCPPGSANLFSIRPGNIVQCDVA